MELSGKDEVWGEVGSTYLASQPGNCPCWWLSLKLRVVFLHFVCCQPCDIFPFIPNIYIYYIYKYMCLFCFLCFRSLVVSVAFLMHFFCSLLPYRWPHNEGRKLHRADTLLSTPKETDNVSFTTQPAHSAAFPWHRTTCNVSPSLLLYKFYIDIYIYHMMEFTWSRAPQSQRLLPHNGCEHWMTGYI